MVSHRNGVTQLRLGGDFLLGEAADISEKLMAVLEVAPQIHLDLANLRNLDTAGLQTLILFRKESHSRGIPLATTPPQGQVAALYQLLGLEP